MSQRLGADGAGSRRAGCRFGRGVCRRGRGAEARPLTASKRCWDWLAAQGARRDDIVVALGGGVVGDLAGFAAATYQRGVGLWQVPTSLLAQVDSSVGGQDRHQPGGGQEPRRGLLSARPGGDRPGHARRRLPEAEFTNGLGEVVKYGLLAGESLFGRLERGAAGRTRDRDAGLLSEVIKTCVRYKAAVVEEDERDTGRRAVLNLGHTTAHALEVEPRLRASAATARRWLWACWSPWRSARGFLDWPRRCSARTRGPVERLGPADHHRAAAGGGLWRGRGQGQEGDRGLRRVRRTAGAGRRRCGSCALPEATLRRGPGGDPSMSEDSGSLVVLHGANLDLLGERPAVHYGTITLAELESMVAAEAGRLGWDCLCLQTNHEGRYIEYLHEHRRRRRADRQSRRVDPLQLRHPRCAGAGAVPGRRGAPLGHHQPRGVAPPLGDLAGGVLHHQRERARRATWRPSRRLVGDERRVVYNSGSHPRRARGT